MADWEATTAEVNNIWQNDIPADRLQLDVDAANAIIARHKQEHAGIVTDDDASIMAKLLAVHFAKAGQPDLVQMGDRAVALPDINELLHETAEGRRVVVYDPAGTLQYQGRGSASMSAHGPRSV